MIMALSQMENEVEEEDKMLMLWEGKLLNEDEIPRNNTFTHLQAATFRKPFQSQMTKTPIQQPISLSFKRSSPNGQSVKGSSTMFMSNPFDEKQEDVNADGTRSPSLFSSGSNL